MILDCNFCKPTPDRLGRAATAHGLTNDWSCGGEDKDNGGIQKPLVMHKIKYCCLFKETGRRKGYVTICFLSRKLVPVLTFSKKVFISPNQWFPLPYLNPCHNPGLNQNKVSGQPPAVAKH